MCVPHNLGRACQERPPQNWQFCGNRSGTIHKLVPCRLGSLLAYFSLREGGEIAVGITIHNSCYGSSFGGYFDARSHLQHHQRHDRADRHRPAAGRRLRQREHPRELQPRPPPVRRVARPSSPGRCQPLSRTWPTSTTRAGTVPVPGLEASLPGWRPHRLDNGDWGSLYLDDTSGLPAELVAARITVQPKQGPS